MKSFYGNRRSVRLIGYDYSQKGMYFLTICAKERQTWFGKIIGGIMEINDLGKKVLSIWNELPQRFAVKTDVSQIMPNHFHGIIEICFEEQGTRSTLSKCIGYFKFRVSRDTGMKIWQRNYYERIIRNEAELWRIRAYIKNNPKNWERDRENEGAHQDAPKGDS